MASSERLSLNTFLIFPDHLLEDGRVFYYLFDLEGDDFMNWQNKIPPGFKISVTWDMLVWLWNRPRFRRLRRKLDVFNK